ncbi:hypothetical protein SAMN04488515_2040 [Cognatiyoonia koreensis]|uniref:Uncharacterized protein n=1 Tax=Cognatiyoonia koreensis TaxID=364200 RepID=A0A1I0QN04_9RHOB|nr:hypothetical protein [Cognatiyoonia koreensis]SEW28760.1 hypothetical protein SAMN04488515_2040 [Cognatiyoonia koreensis]
MLKSLFIGGALAMTCACSIPYGGEVPLDPDDTTSCANIPTEVGSGSLNPRENLLRCTPQRQPLVGS